jgi:exonuclease SbcC
MRPRKLVLSGVTCFRDQETIDFTELDLFAITGPTGAGKTSILDAMTFALYGRIFRVEREFRSLMSLGAKEMRVLFEFSVGPTNYRVLRVAFSNTQRSQVALERACAADEWEPLARGAREADQKITDILGLDFDGFTKAVLLPQNAFGRFLQGDPSERRSILEALLGLKIYEGIQRRANQLAESLRAQVTLLGQQLSRDYVDVTEERLAELRSLALNAEQRVEETRMRRDERSVALTIARRLSESRRHARNLAEQAATLAHQCTQLDQQIVEKDKRVAAVTDAIAELDREVGTIRYDDARHLLLGSLEARALRRSQILERYAELEEQDEKRKRKLATLRGSGAASEANLSVAKSALAKCREVSDEAERAAQALEQRHGTAAAIAVLQRTEHQWHEDRAGLDNIETELSDLAQRLETLREESERLGVAVLAADNAVVSAEARQTAAQGRAGELRDLHTRVTALQQDRELALQYSGAAESALAAKETELAEAEKAAPALEEAVKAARRACEVAQGELEELRSLNTAYALRGRLEIGEPCPVCEEPVRDIPAPHPEHALHEAEASLKRAQARTVTAERAYQAAGERLTRVRTELASCRRDQVQARDRVRNLGERLAALLPQMVRENTELASHLKAAQNEIVLAGRQILSTRTAARKAHEALAGVEGERRSLPDRTDLEQSQAELLAKCEAAAAEVREMCGESPGPKAQAALKRIGAALEAAIAARARAAAAVSPAAEAVHRCELERGRFVREIETEEQAAMAAEAERQRLTSERHDIEQWLRRGKIPLTNDVLVTLRAEIASLASAKTRREECLQRRERLAGSLGTLQLEHGTLTGRRRECESQRSTSQEAADMAHEEAEVQLTHLEAAAGNWPGWQDATAKCAEETWLARITEKAQMAHEQAVADRTSATTRVEELAGRLVRANECRAKHALAQQEERVAHELGQLLMANRFRSYLLEEAIRTLAADSSRHLQELSGNRYRFHNDGTDFEIVDGWNADEMRSVRTLSGGETFLASLALALGLAEGLPTLGIGEHGRQRLESLFIDEGFGTLDTDETLGSVAQVLENLQFGNRLVGIVTHLKGLADRLPAQIRVVKTQTGSHIEVPAE